MKKCLVVAVLSFVFVNNVWAQENKLEIKTQRHLEIFRCVGLQRFNADVWLRFEHFTDDPF